MKKKLPPQLTKTQKDSRYRPVERGEILSTHDIIISEEGVCKAGVEHKVRLLAGYRYNPIYMAPIYRKKGLS